MSFDDADALRGPCQTPSARSVWRSSTTATATSNVRLDHKPPLA